MCTLTVLFLSLGDIPVICKVFIPSIVLSEISILLVSPAFILSVLIFYCLQKVQNAQYPQKALHILLLDL